MKYLIALLFSLILVLPTSNKLVIGDFSNADLNNEHPEHWESMNFRGIPDTEYKLTQIDDRIVVKAISEKSSSGLVRKKEIDLKEYPIMRWEWRVDNIFEDGDVTKKSGDDYPARIYVIFDYDLSNLSWTQRNMIRALRTFYGDVPSRAINYIYESKAEIGTIISNPYSELVTMVVVDSGEDNLGKWVSYERNIYEDYLEIYGEEPPKIGGIAIMTDSDDTKESAVAYFGDISFHKK